MPVLYRKYRPQRFAEIVGQSPIVATLKNAVKAGTLAHAYLFTGSRGVGKTSVARILAKAANCLNPSDGDACGTCEVCTAIAQGTFLDLVEIDAASNTGVENVRELIEHVKFQPSRGTYKVFIIDEVHMLSKPAFNALLKTLEEPPVHAMFVLATTDIHKVPDTIISRTQRFDFRKIGEVEIVKHLKGVAEQEQLPLADEILELVAGSAQGGLRDAMSLLDKVSALGTDITLAEAQAALGMTSLKLSHQIMNTVSSGQPGTLPALFDELLMNGTDFVVLARSLLEYCRKLLVCKITGSGEGLNLLPEDLASAQQLAGKMTVPEIMHVTRLYLRAYKDMATAPSPELPLLLSSVEASLKNAVPASSSIPAQASHSMAASSVSAPSSSADRPIAGTSLTVVEETVVPLDTEEEPIDSVTWDEVQGFWPKVIEKIKIINSPLATLVKNSPLHEVNRGTVIMHVKYLFHKEHLESKKNYALLTGIIHEVCGKRLRVNIQINKASSLPDLAEVADPLGGALKVFGGELVE
jgi:DNA polymerase-3 subunit gamma/tau